MSLLKGEAAATALHDLVRDKAQVPALAVNSDAREGGQVSILAVALPERAILCDPCSVPDLPRLFATGNAFCTYDAKQVDAALWRTVHAAPQRWACIRLTEQLILGGRYADTGLEAIAQRHGVLSPPPVDRGFDALAEHARRLALLVAAQIPTIRANELQRVSRVEAHAVAAIAAMERHGMPFEADRWRSTTHQVSAERRSVHQQLKGLLAANGRRDLFGETRFNLDNDAELKQALRGMGHPVPNTRRRTLAGLKPPLGPLLCRYRELSKLLSTYGDAFLTHVGEDGRIHPTFEQIGASTGRMACRAPNLQAMVKDSPHRECFRAPATRRLVMGDYAACELRILAEMSGDPVFCEAFARGEDVHARVASTVFGKPVSKTVNPELRQRAKAVNFGLVYGMGAGGLARAIEVSQTQAQDLLRRYFQTFPKIGAFLESSAKEALERGFARTLTGRRLYLDGGDDRGTRAQAERIAKNMPIQGTSADITKIALARVHRRLRSLCDAWLVNCVHDEIVVECAADDAEAVKRLLADEMKLAGSKLMRRVALAVDVSVGHIWGK